MEQIALIMNNTLSRSAADTLLLQWKLTNLKVISLWQQENFAFLRGGITQNFDPA